MASHPEGWTASSAPKTAPMSRMIFSCRKLHTSVHSRRNAFCLLAELSRMKLLERSSSYGAEATLAERLEWIELQPDVYHNAFQVELLLCVRALIPSSLSTLSLGSSSAATMSFGSVTRSP